LIFITRIKINARSTLSNKSYDKEQTEVCSFHFFTALEKRFGAFVCFRLVSAYPFEKGKKDLGNVASVKQRWGQSSHV